MFILYGVAIGVVLGLLARRATGRPRRDPLPLALGHHRGPAGAGRPVLRPGGRADRRPRTAHLCGLDRRRARRDPGRPGHPGHPGGGPRRRMQPAGDRGQRRYMPAAPGALAALGKGEPAVYSNSSVVADPALWFLTDRFVMPQLGAVRQRLQHRRRHHRHRDRADHRAGHAPPGDAGHRANGGPVTVATTRPAGPVTPATTVPTDNSPERRGR